MAFVRKHGHQVAIVHGERDAATRQVQQRVLFSLYSKAEADAALGLRKTDPPLSFRGLLESHHKNLRFDWRKIEAGIVAFKDELPDTYAYPTSGVAPALRSGVVAFARALLAANPQSVFSAAQAVQKQRRELHFLRELIDWRLKLCDEQEEHAYNRDNEFGWISRFAGEGIPAEALEWLDGLHERGEDDQAEAVAGLLVEAWPKFADGHNMLGLIALERGDHDRALLCFARTMEVGRTLFPKRIAKSRWWTDHHTRPYMRGMRNTVLTLLWSGCYDEVLGWCDRLEQECHDEDSANVHRAAALLNLGRWVEARDRAARYVEIWPNEDFVAAFAAFELGDLEDALARWLHAAIQLPRTAWMLTGQSSRTKPETYEEVRDHNAGVNLMRTLSSYLKRKPARRFFAGITNAREVVALFDEYGDVVLLWHGNRGPDRTAYSRMMEMGTSEFAQQQAVALRHLIGFGET